MSIILPSGPQSIAQLFKTAGQIWKTTFTSTFLLYVLMLGSYLLLDIYKMLYPAAAVVADTPRSASVVFISIILWLTGFFFYLSFDVSIIYRINNIIKFQDLGFSETVTYGFRRFFPALAVSLLLGLGIFFGSLLFIIPGIIFAVYFCLSWYFVIFGKGVIESLQESYHLVKNHWWRTALIIMVIYLPLILLFFALIITIVAMNPDLNPEQLSQKIASIPNLMLYYFLGLTFIGIPISHFINSVFLAYFYDLHNRKKTFEILA